MAPTDATATAAGFPEEEGVPLSLRGPAPTDVVVGFGFWLFLLSDIVIFSGLFAAYAVLVSQTNGGPGGLELFDKRHAFIETACLLASSFSCGLMMIGVERKSMPSVYFWSACTFVLGLTFIGFEFSEFASMVAHGAGPSRSAFLSAFFTLVGTHGLHVSIGLCWLIIMLFQINMLGLRPLVTRRMLCFSLFWHALDIVWIGVFTIVYLGAR
jgi:cytochrome o ubiquinol oxidase subunit 3